MGMTGKKRYVIYDTDLRDNKAFSNTSFFRLTYAIFGWGRQRWEKVTRDGVVDELCVETQFCIIAHTHSIGPLKTGGTGDPVPYKNWGKF